MKQEHEVTLEAFAYSGQFVSLDSVDAHTVRMAFYFNRMCDLRWECTAMYRADPKGLKELCQRIEVRLNRARAEARREVRDAMCGILGAVRITEVDDL